MTRAAELYGSVGILETEYRLEIGRCLSKLGTLDPFREELTELAEVAVEEDVLALYQRFREYRMESEWRDEFVSIFEKFASSLPSPDGDATVMGHVNESSRNPAV